MQEADPNKQLTDLVCEKAIEYAKDIFEKYGVCASGVFLTTDRVVMEIAFAIEENYGVSEDVVESILVHSHVNHTLGQLAFFGIDK